MFRITDIIAIEEFVFPENLELNFTIEVKDKIASWNERKFEINIQDGKAITNQLKTTNPDLKLDIKAFTQLLLGYRSIEQLVELQKAEATPETISFLNKAFPKNSAPLMTKF